MTNIKTKEVLNQLVAELSQFSSIIHQTHWYMRGPNFMTMHPKMDELMDTVNDQIDEVAERLISIGGSPYSTLKEFDEHSKLESVSGDFTISIEDHLQRLLDSYVYLNDLYIKGSDIAADEGDKPTEDLLIGFRSETEKMIWMLSATLGK